MKIVKFKKEHVAGFAKGAVKSLDNNTADRLEATGFVQEATEDELVKYNAKMAKVKPVSTYEDIKTLANHNSSECEGCGDGEEPCDDCKEDEIEKKYYILTQEDIDANEIAAIGLEVGDEVEINDFDELVVDEEGKLIKKIEGNV